MMPAHAWDIVVSRIAQARIKRLVISGGEPLLVPNIQALLLLAKRRGLIISLITNGVLLDVENIEQLCQVLDEIVVSIDGSTAEVHGKMREVAQNNFNHLIWCLKQFAQSPVRSRVNSVVSKVNLSQLEHLGLVLLDCKVDEWRLLQFYPMNDAEHRRSTFSITQREFETFRAKLEDKYKGSDMLLTFGDNETMSGSYFSIAPNGSVFTSQHGRVIWLGHISSDSIEDMYKHPAFSSSKHLEQYRIVESWDV